MPTQNYTDTVQGSLYEPGMVINNDYTFDPGVCILPIAEDPPDDNDPALLTWSPVVIGRLHAPYRVRNARYETVKSNNPPVMPTPQKDSGAFVFVGGSLNITNMMNQSFLSFDWQVRSEYMYVENCVSRNQDGYVLGIPPWTWETSVINAANVNPAQPTVGAVAYAGPEVLVSLNMGNNIYAAGGPDAPSAGTYFYNMPSYLPGVFFSDNLVNGGVPVNTPPVA